MSSSNYDSNDEVTSSSNSETNSSNSIRSKVMQRKSRNSKQTSAISMNLRAKKETATLNSNNSGKMKRHAGVETSRNKNVRGKREPNYKERVNSSDDDSNDVVTLSSNSITSSNNSSNEGMRSNVKQKKSHGSKQTSAMSMNLRAKNETDTLNSIYSCESKLYSGVESTREKNAREKKEAYNKAMYFKGKKANTICRHCKSRTLDKNNTMFVCTKCTIYYHIGCILPCDMPPITASKENKFIQKSSFCMRCTALSIDDKIRRIVTWRWREETRDVAEPWKYYAPREFLLSYWYRSYFECEWVDEIRVLVFNPNNHVHYVKDMDLTKPPSPHILTDSLRHKMTKEEIDIHEKYLKWGIDPESLQPQRVVDLDDETCVVKWRGLNYGDLTTESLDKVDEFDGLQEAIDFFKKLKKELLSDSKVTVPKSKLTKIPETPGYLGPSNCETDAKPSLYPYQLEGLNWLRSTYSNDVNTILADEMGLGKTIQAIAFLYSLRQENVSKGPFLVVVPMSTLVNWEREFEFWAPEFSVFSYYGNKDDRKEMKKYMHFASTKKKVPSFHVLLTTYEFVFGDETILSRYPWEILILDEAQRVKNDESRLFLTLNRYRIKHRVLMTGTPLQNNLEELYHLLNFMQAKSFNNEETFMKHFEDVSQEKQVRTLQATLKKHILRRVKSDVFKSIPAKEEQVVLVDMSPLQKKWYKLTLTSNRDALEGKFKKIRFANLLMQLRKVCNHPYLNMNAIEDQMREDGTYDVPELVAASGKMDLLQKMLVKLGSGGHRTLLFSGMTKLLDLIEDMLDYMNIEYERIDGTVCSASRQQAIDRFNNPNSKSMVFLLSTKAGGIGINLSVADTVIIYDADWNPHNDIQALSRAHRIGQTKKVMVYRFLTRNSVEEKIMKTTQKKMMINNLVIKDCTKKEFHQILSYGTKELFDENATTQKITFDDAALEVLLDRSRETVVINEDSFLDTCFSGFKVADCIFASDNQVAEDTKMEVDEPEDGIEPESFWAALLPKEVKPVATKQTLPDATTETLPDLVSVNRLRARKHVSYESHKPHNSKLKCRFFPMFCRSSKHEDIVMCDMDMESYYKVSSGFACPVCLVVIMTTWDLFKLTHGNHLMAFTKMKKTAIYHTMPHLPFFYPIQGDANPFRVVMDNNGSAIVRTPQPQIFVFNPKPPANGSAPIFIELSDDDDVCITEMNVDASPGVTNSKPPTKTITQQTRPILVAKATARKPEVRANCIYFPLFCCSKTHVTESHCSLNMKKYYRVSNGYACPVCLVVVMTTWKLFRSAHVAHLVKFFVLQKIPIFKTKPHLNIDDPIPQGAITMTSTRRDLKPTNISIIEENIPRQITIPTAALDVKPIKSDITMIDLTSDDESSMTPFEVTPMQPSNVTISDSHQSMEPSIIISDVNSSIEPTTVMSDMNSSIKPNITLSNVNSSIVPNIVMLDVIEPKIAFSNINSSIEPKIIVSDMNSSIEPSTAISGVISSINPSNIVYDKDRYLEPSVTISDVNSSNKLSTVMPDVNLSIVSDKTPNLESSIESNLLRDLTVSVIDIAALYPPGERAMDLAHEELNHNCKSIKPSTNTVIGAPVFIEFSDDDSDASL